MGWLFHFYFSLVLAVWLPEMYVFESAFEF